MTDELAGRGSAEQNDAPEPWRAMVRKYQDPSPWRSSWQIANSVVPYVLLWVAMYFAAAFSCWLVVPLAVLGGAFLIRIFIIFHDCTHGSFFASRRANDVVGFVTGLMVFTPYHQWRREHTEHHAGAGNLDRRGLGDVWTLTVEEFLAASKGKRLSYRLLRNPIVLFLLGPLFLFLVLQRIPAKEAKRRERHWAHFSNLILLLVATGLIAVFGLKLYLLIQLTTMAVATSAGVWLFYVQHQFEDVYWERKDDWDFAQAALQGSSFYQLPKVLQWFSGNIGYHHIHHLSPRIPNYRLEQAHEAEPLFQAVKPLTLRRSLKSFTYRLWDETEQKLVGYSRAKEKRHLSGKA